MQGSYLSLVLKITSAIALGQGQVKFLKQPSTFFRWCRKLRDCSSEKLGKGICSLVPWEGCKYFWLKPNCLAGRWPSSMSTWPLHGAFSASPKYAISGTGLRGFPIAFPTEVLPPQDPASEECKSLPHKEILPSHFFTHFWGIQSYL